MIPIRLTAMGFLAAGLLFLRADDPPALKPPPGYKVVYRDVGGGKKAAIFVQEQMDMSGLTRNLADDPLDPQKVFSETNPASNKTFMPASAPGSDKSSGINAQQSFETKVYDTSTTSSVYDTGAKPTYHTASYAGAKAAAGYDQSFATTDTPSDMSKAHSPFAPVGAAEQNRAAPIDAKTYGTFASADANKDFNGPEADAIRQHARPGAHIDGDLQLVGEIPNRPLSIDEVRELINHGFKPDLDQPPPPAGKPLNDPNYQPVPLRIEPTSADDAPAPVPAAASPGTGGHKVDEDDANDPVPSPGMMADPPENSEALPNK
jgi:hypothetical protein